MNTYCIPTVVYSSIYGQSLSPNKIDFEMECFLNKANRGSAGGQYFSEPSDPFNGQSRPKPHNNAEVYYKWCR